MARVVQRRVVELSGKRCCEFCGAPPQPVTALAEAVDRMHKALGEVQDALEAQEQMIEDLRTDTGDEQQACPDPTPLPTDPTSREPLSLLTAREREILVLVSQGKSNRRVASSLGISEKTVRNHLSAVFSKVGASDRTQAVVMGIRGGIVSIGE
ncbi:MULTISPECIES: response regulator transcription factor [unclassified Streptomyces]|uniref:response regulator transcription factor n=1 Tax=unclassified Streptomyces TaxID=2593676 RepID=UPI0020354C84|nr:MULTISPECIES: response regulator transcription factor [unclassified Streptomyces]MCX5016008.1 response regulator transcription factor [Streptomyces sp. NBC_00555]